MSTSRKHRFLFCLTFAISLAHLALTAPLPVEKKAEEGGGLTLGSIFPGVESNKTTPASTTSLLPEMASGSTTQVTTSPTSDAAKMTTTPSTRANWSPKQLVKPASLVRGARFQTDDKHESMGKGKAVVQMDYDIDLGNNEKKKVAKIEKLFEKFNEYLVCTYEDQKDCDERLMGKNQKETKLKKTVTEEKSDTEHKAPKRPVYWWEKNRGKNQAPMGHHWFPDHPRALYDEPLGGVVLHPGRRFPLGNSVYRPEAYYGSPYSSFPVSHHKSVYGLSRHHPGYFGGHFVQHPGFSRWPHTAGFRHRRASLEHPLHRGVISERDLKKSLLEIEAIRNGKRVKEETKELPWQQHRRPDWRYDEDEKSRVKNNEEFPVHSHGWEKVYDEMSPLKLGDKKPVAKKMSYGRKGQQPTFYGHAGNPSRTSEFREEMFWPKNRMQVDENAVREGYASHDWKMEPFWTYKKAYLPQDRGTWRGAIDGESEFKKKAPESHDDGWRRWANKLRARKR